jgi:hypothetical protein
VIEYQGDLPVNTILTPYIGTAAYAQFVTKNFPTVAYSGKSSNNHKGLRAMTVTAPEWTKNSFAGVFATTEVGQMSWSVFKLRLAIPASTTATFYLRSVKIASRKAKARICIVLDDGYISVYERAAPILEAAGIRFSVATMPSKAGVAGYMSEAQLADLVSRGHLCVGHGPSLNNTNLFAAPYTTTAERIADITAASNWLLARNLTTAKGAQCYIWPEGFYSSTAGESDLLDAFFAAGFTAGRGVEPLANGVYVDSLSSQNKLRAVIPTIGHTYAGVTNTADDATETANIAAIVARINAAATNGTDVHLMLHKVVPRGNAAAGSIEIEMDRLATLAAAIKTQVAAGLMTSVTMDEFA